MHHMRISREGGRKSGKDERQDCRRMREGVHSDVGGEKKG